MVTVAPSHGLPGNDQAKVDSMDTLAGSLTNEVAAPYITPSISLHTVTGSLGRGDVSSLVIYAFLSTVTCCMCHIVQLAITSRLIIQLQGRNLAQGEKPKYLDFL